MLIGAWRSLRQQRAAGAEDLVFVDVVRLESRDEDLPDAGPLAQAHRVAPAVPVVEIADHADAPRIGRPYREGEAQHGVAFMMRAFGEEMDVEVAEHRREGIDVVELDGAERALGAQTVAEARPAAEHAQP